MASVERIRPAPSVVTAAPVAASTIVARVRKRLGVMLVLIATAAAVAGVALATLIARREATAAIAAAGVVLAVTLVIAAAMVAERRSLRRDTTRGLAAHERAVPMRAAAPSNGTDWIGEPAGGEPQSVRGQADLLEELLEWPQSRGA